MLSSNSSRSRRSKYSCAVLPVDLVMHVPIALDFDPAILRDQIMAGQQLMDVLEQRLFADRVLECQIFRERFGIGLDARQERQQRLRLRGEIKNAVDAASNKTA